MDRQQSSEHKSASGIISLKEVPSSEIDETLRLWNEGLEYQQQKLAELSETNIFRKYLDRNRPGAAGPIRSILSCVRVRYGAFGLLESPYLDSDFWHNHSTFYSGSFSRYPVECDRLHFFSGPEERITALKERLLAGATAQEIEDKLQLRYCGYCVLRPTPAFVVGRTALAFDERPGEEICDRVALLAEEKDSKPFLKVKYPCVANLCNARFEICTVEFIQQDPNLGHCGTAALWVTTKAMANRFATNRFQYGTITRQALRGWNRDREVNMVYDPSNMDSGLSVSEMRNALAETSANSMQFMAHNREDGEDGRRAFARLSHEIYSFVESGIPALLCVEKVDSKEGHVVVAVGHGLPAEVDFRQCIPACQVVPSEHNVATADRHYLLSSAIRVYYAHDDSYGPFNRVVLLRGEAAEEQGDEPRIRVRLGRRATSDREYWLRQVLVPVPKVVRTYSSQPLVMLPSYFETRSYSAAVWKRFEGGAFVWRSLLIEGAEFKQSVCRRHYSNKLRAWYASLHLPKYVWLYEMCFVPEAELEHWAAKSHWDVNTPSRNVVGEFLYDATCPSYDVGLLAERVGGLFRDYRTKGAATYERDSGAGAGYFECYAPRRKSLIRGVSDHVDLGQETAEEVY